MENFRVNPPQTINGIRVVVLEDYHNLTSYNFELKQQQPLDFSPSNVLIFKLADCTKIALRPSGTEPKIKYYFSVNQKFDSKLSWKAQEAILDQHLNQLSSAILS